MDGVKQFISENGDGDVLKKQDIYDEIMNIVIDEITAMICGATYSKMAHAANAVALAETNEEAKEQAIVDSLLSDFLSDFLQTFCLDIIFDFEVDWTAPVSEIIKTLPAAIGKEVVAILLDMAIENKRR